MIVCKVVIIRFFFDIFVFSISISCVFETFLLKINIINIEYNIINI